MSRIITERRKGSFECWERKSSAISHAIIAQVRPRSFISPLQFLVGALLYKKHGSRNLIDILSSLGFSALCRYIMKLESSCILRPERTISPTSFCQYVFDNSDFDINTIDGQLMVKVRTKVPTLLLRDRVLFVV